MNKYNIGDLVEMKDGVIGIIILKNEETSNRFHYRVKWFDPNNRYFSSQNDYTLDVYIKKHYPIKKENI